ncbi:Phosphate transport system permease protein [gamma proteobacterium HdN1]|nr:Phosphate transport system permease protein [gamma proteobacterium HdN1]
MGWQYKKRKLINFVGLSLTVVATLFTLFWLLWILSTLISHGWQALDVSMFLKDTPAPGEEGGLRNAIIGSILVCITGVAIGAPIGVLAATWLAEYGRGTPLAAVIRFVNDVLLSAPSIIIGIFIYGLIVVHTGGFSGWAGAVALAVILLPVVVRTSEDMLLLVPDQMREAAAALGAQRWRLIVDVVYRAAKRGMITGILLGFARISGETAPLLFTALNNQFFSMDMTEVIANLPMMIFQYAMSPYETWQNLAWAGALLITLSILAINLSLRLIWRDPKRGN